MANTKISALTSATTPLAGTEVLPIVQSGATVKVANNDLRPKQIQSNATTGVLQVAGPAAAATRTMTVPDANFTAARTDAAQSFTGDQTLSTGNLIQGTAAKGINFTANTGAAGMTSQLLNWYEEGTWTPTLTTEFGTNFTSVSYTNQIGRYTRLGRMVFVQCRLTTSAITVGSASGVVVIGGLPFNAASGQNSAGSIASAYNWGANSPITALVAGGSAYLIKQLVLGGDQDNLVPADVNTGANGNDVYFSACYTV